jgi:glycerol-3-phosphate O-acyltransferase
VSESNWEEEREKLLERQRKSEHVGLESIEREAQTTEEESRKQAHARVWELARQQGVKPIRNMAELQGDFWPEEESVDDFLSWVRELRQSDKPRSIPE